MLVHLYEEHGDEFVERLRGMFAFAIWDAAGARLFLARDRVGKKPLFYAARGARSAFASELRALLAGPRDARARSNPAAHRRLPDLQYVPQPLSAPSTACASCRPASTAGLSTTAASRVERYWKPRLLRAELDGLERRELPSALRERFARRSGCG